MAKILIVDDDPDMRPLIRLTLAKLGHQPSLAATGTEGLRMAVCSNAVRDTVELMLERSGLMPHCEFVISNEDVTLPKPAPEIYEAAIRRMNLLPAQVLVVEDAPHGVTAARRSGANVCQVSGFPDVDYWRIRACIDEIERQAPTC